MATTIATSAPHYEQRESVTVSSDGRATSIVVFVDAETAQSGARVGFDLEIFSAEDMGELRTFHDDPEVEPGTSSVEPWGTEYRARNQRNSMPFTCHEGAEHCAYVFTVEPTNPVPYDVSGFVILDSGVEFAEDAVFIVTTSAQ